jgi:hypothetical protein
MFAPDATLTLLAQMAEMRLFEITHLLPPKSTSSVLKKRKAIILRGDSVKTTALIKNSLKAVSALKPHYDTFLKHEHLYYFFGELKIERLLLTDPIISGRHFVGINSEQVAAY